MIRSAADRPHLPRLGGAFLQGRVFRLAALATVLSSPLAAQDGVTVTADGAIPNAGEQRVIITAPRIGGDLFPPQAVPDGACLTSAPELGTKMPGFAIDGRTIKKARDLANLRRKMDAKTVFVSGGSFRGESLAKIKLSNICFLGTDFAGSDWRGVTASGLGFVDADLSAAKMAGARLPFVLFRNAKLAGVDATGADFRFGRFDGGWDGSVRDWTLTRAGLRGFRFECGATKLDGCPIDREGVALTGADLTRASLFAFPVSDLDLAGTTIDATELSLPQTTALPTANLMGPVIVRSRRRATIFFPFEVPRLREAALAGGEDVGSTGPANCAGDAVAQAICASGDPMLKDLAAEVAALEAKAPARTGRARGRGRRAAAAPVTTRASADAALAACLTGGEDTADCLTRALNARREALGGAGARPAWTQEAGVLLFVSDDVPPPPSGQGDPLFGRLQPVLLDSAQSVALLKVDGGGGVQAKGQALGGCQLDAAQLSYDAGRGGLATPDGTMLLKVTGQRMRSASEPQQTGPLRCRPGASFATMRRVPLDQESLRTLWDAF